eukprot:SAG11_NODE_268_length_11447_cov_3.136135_11_plen_243_part_00
MGGGWCVGAHLVEQPFDARMPAAKLVPQRFDAQARARRQICARRAERLRLPSARRARLLRLRDELPPERVTAPVEGVEAASGLELRHARRLSLKLQRRQLLRLGAAERALQRGVVGPSGGLRFAHRRKRALLLFQLRAERSGRGSEVAVVLVERGADRRDPRLQAPFQRRQRRLHRRGLDAMREPGFHLLEPWSDIRRARSPPRVLAPLRLEASLQRAACRWGRAGWATDAAQTLTTAGCPP